MIVFVAHIAGGSVGLVAGTVAILARKGGPLHRLAGNIFFAAMVVMALFAAVLAIIIPGQVVNLLIATFALYLVGTAWMTVRLGDGVGRFFEGVALAVSLCLSAPFVVLSFQLLTGLKPFITSAVPLKGPVLIAVVGFTAVLVVAAFGDAKVIVVRRLTGKPRMARHLWRMCVGLTLAAGSGFTNGFARLLPGPYHVPAAFFLPQFIPLGLLAYWMIRVRLTRWTWRREVTA
jgi:uncharacterized membrane protein